MTLTEPDLQAALSLAFDLSDAPPDVRRVVHEVGGAAVTGLRWGDTPRVVLLHGRAPTQTAHAWDRLAIAWGRPLLALDLPGHGLSSWRPDGTYAPRVVAPAVADTIEASADAPVTLVGPSFGALVAIAVAAARRDLVEQLVLIDATPGQPGAPLPRVDPRLDPPDGFDDRDRIVELLAALDPDAAPERLAYNVHHATEQREDGRWSWRRDPGTPPGTGAAGDADPVGDWLDRDGLWDDLEALDRPITLVRGGRSRAVSDADVGELLTRRPDARLVVVDDAGHEVQRDQPEQLVAILDRLTTDATP